MCKPSAPTAAMDQTSNKEFHNGTANKQQPPSGFQQRRRWIEGGLLLLSVCYGCVYQWNPHVPVEGHLCENNITNTNDVCLRPDLIAYKVTSMLAMLTMGLMGAYHWHFSSHLKQMTTPEDRLFGTLPAADVQNVVIFCYQVWDFVVSVTIPEHLDPLYLMHHVLAMFTAYCSLEYQMVPYYSIFYGGCSEVSSIFLIFLDKQQMLVVEQGSWLDTWMLICKGMFFVTFTAYRIVGWIYYSFPLWKDCQQVIASGKVEQHRPGKTFVLRLFQGLDLVLGLLQCYWYCQILEALVVLIGAKE